MCFNSVLNDYSIFINSCKIGNLELVKAIIHRSGRNMNLQEGLYQACLHGKMNIVKYLVFFDNIKPRDNGGELFRLLCYSPNISVNEMEWYYKLGSINLQYKDNILLRTLCESPFADSQRMAKIDWIVRTCRYERNPIKYEILVWMRDYHNIDFE